MVLYLEPLGAGHLPIVFAVVFVANLGFTYVISVARSDVDPLFPYVSSAADRRPQSCLFSLLLNISSCLCMLIIYLRAILVESLIQESNRPLLKLNTATLIVGEIGGFAMMVVANVQETAITPVHMTAALTCFGCGCLYMVGTTIVTFWMYPLYNGRRIAIIRLVITILSIIAFFVAVGFGTYAAYVFHQVYPNLPTPRPWTTKLWQPGYEFHVISAIGEWSLTLLHIAYILTHSRDFEKIRVSLSVDSLVSHLDHTPLRLSRDNLVY